MDTAFIATVQKLIAEQGKEALLNAAKCKGLLADYTAGEYKKESRLLLQALEAGTAIAIDSTQELEICKQQQARHLQEEYFLAEDMAVEVVDVLCLVLRDGATMPSTAPAAGQAKGNAISTASTDRKKQDAESHFAKGKSFFDAEDWDNAIAEYTKAIKLDPNNAYYYFNRGWAYEFEKDYDSAIADYTQASKLDPTDKTYIAEMLAVKEKATQATKRKAEAEQIAKAQAKAQHEAREKAEQAAKAKAKALQDEEFHFARGKSFSDKQDWDNAIAEYTKAIGLNPNKSVYYNNRGYAYNAKKDYDSAIADYTQAIKLDPINTNYKQNLAKARAATQAVEFSKRGDKYFKECPDPFSDYFNMAYYRHPSYNRLDSVLDNFAHAIEEYTQALKLDPDNDTYKQKLAVAFGNRGEVFYGKSEYDRAIEDFTQALKLYPNNDKYKPRLEGAKDSLRFKRNHPVLHGAGNLLLDVFLTKD
ncbi:hypothetical protein FACS189461_3760 [Spirochaetia bacterium]|nr:hypothetical protein FACS189461_3760 [Spirochaetia bacterium]